MSTIPMLDLKGKLKQPYFSSSTTKLYGISLCLGASWVSRAACLPHSLAVQVSPMPAEHKETGTVAIAYSCLGLCPKGAALWTRRAIQLPTGKSDTELWHDLSCYDTGFFSGQDSNIAM